MGRVPLRALFTEVGTRERERNLEGTESKKPWSWDPWCPWEASLSLHLSEPPPQPPTPPHPQLFIICICTCEPFSSSLAQASFPVHAEACQGLRQSLQTPIHVAFTVAARSHFCNFKLLEKSQTMQKPSAQTPWSQEPTPAPSSRTRSEKFQWCILI
jgi:hypothetical protein